MIRRLVHKKAILTIGIILCFVIGLLFPSPMFQPQVFFQRDWHIVKDTTGMRISNAEVYEGTIDVFNEKPQGYGVLKERNKTYAGRWDNGSLVYGKMDDINGTYEGGFNRALEYEGFGTLNCSSAYLDQHKKAGDPDSMIVLSYVGNWKNNKMNGLGRAFFADSSMVFGEFKDNLYQRVRGQKFKIGESIYGIDLSHFQHKIEWDNIALYSDEYGKVNMSDMEHSGYLQPVFFVFIKATDGTRTIDGTFYNYMSMAKKHGITRGAYHFFRALENIEEQAKNFTETAFWLPGDLPPVLDMELESELTEIGSRIYLDKAIDWLMNVEAEMGVRPMVYTSNHIYENYVKHDGRFRQYKFWIARYNTIPPENDNWLFWQFTGTGMIMGIDDNVDLDLYHYNFASFRHFIDAVQLKNPVDSVLKNISP